MVRRLALAVAPLAVLVASSCSSNPDAPTKTYPPTKPTAEQQAAAEKLLTGPDWYRHAVIYEVYIRSFTDTNADGIGDFAGLTSRLDYLKELGVDAIWLMPMMPTPFKDSGYDIADYRGINPDYGDMAAFDAFLAAAHQRKIRVMVDLVLNHTASTHPWFQDSRSSKTAAKADWYVWSDTPSSPNIGCGTYGPQFGTNAWTFEPARNQYYFHRFYPEQPDLNYRNPEVVAETLDTAKFWLDKGVDGFRCDVIGLLYESATECEMIPETVDYIKQLRALLDKYPDRAMVAEASLGGATKYFGSGKDMFHMAFNFPFGYFWGVSLLGQNRKIIDDAFATALATYPAGAQDALPIGSHDVSRAYTKAAGKPWRQRRVAEISMFARGTPFVYYGEELGLHDGTGVVVDGRDAARAPMPWTKAEGHGFSTAKPWIPFAEAAAETNVEVEDADPASMLNFYRALLAFRRGHAVWGTGEMTILDVDNPSLFAFVRKNADEAYLVVENLSEDPQTGIAPAAFAQVGKVVWGTGEATLGNASVTLKLAGTESAVFALPK
jgi:glycosidase